MILSTSYMDEAGRCARVHVLDEGRLLASGAPEELMRHFGVSDFADIFLKK